VGLLQQKKWGSYSKNEFQQQHLGLYNKVRTSTTRSGVPTARMSSNNSTWEGLLQREWVPKNNTGGLQQQEWVPKTIIWTQTKGTPTTERELERQYVTIMML
jgi:hypothetical protein